MAQTNKSWKSRSVKSKKHNKKAEKFAMENKLLNNWRNITRNFVIQISNSIEKWGMKKLTLCIRRSHTPSHSQATPLNSAVFNGILSAKNRSNKSFASA